MNSTGRAKCVKQRSDHSAGAIQFLRLLRKHFSTKILPLALAKTFFLIKVKVHHMHVALGS